MPGCACACFTYVPMRGSYAARCICKHELDDHRLGLRCGRCSCAGYAPPQRCDCGMAHAQHSTCFETRSQRQAGGRAAVAVGGGRPEFEAATGAVTDMMSLLPAGDRTVALQQHLAHPLLIQQQHSAALPFPPASSLSLLIRGVQGPHAVKVNGSYRSCGAELHGGQLLWRRTDAPAVIECMPSRRSWQVKPESRFDAASLSLASCHAPRSLGKDGCWAAITCEGELQGGCAPSPRASTVQQPFLLFQLSLLACRTAHAPAVAHGRSGWRIWDSSSKAFHEQVRPVAFSHSASLHHAFPALFHDLASTLPPPQPDVRLEVCNSAVTTAAPPSAAASTGSHAPITDMYRSLHVSRCHHHVLSHHTRVRRTLLSPPLAPPLPSFSSLNATSTILSASWRRRSVQAPAPTAPHHSLLHPLTSMSLLLLRRIAASSLRHEQTASE